MVHTGGHGRCFGGGNYDGLSVHKLPTGKVSGVHSLPDEGIRISWWGRPLIWLMVLSAHIGLVEPTVQWAERSADWLIRLGAVRVVK